MKSKVPTVNKIIRTLHLDLLTFSKKMVLQILLSYFMVLFMYVQLGIRIENIFLTTYLMTFTQSLLLDFFFENSFFFKLSAYEKFCESCIE